MDGMMHAAAWSTMSDGVVAAAADAAAAHAEEESTTDLRRGPWTVEEDLVLVNYINVHGEGRWNSLARCAGLKRTGKSCRLRWLNYLRPDVRRGNITPEEQLLILELHSRWGNRWSKIAQYLPGRTDNEIKNYWRTRVQKHAKQLQCDVNSKQFKDIMRYLWMPRLVERIQAANSAATVAKPNDTSMGGAVPVPVPVPERMAITNNHGQLPADPLAQVKIDSPESAGMACSSTSDSMVTPPPQGAVPVVEDQYKYFVGGLPEALSSPCRYFDQGLPLPAGFEQNMMGMCGGNGGDMMADGLWAGMDDFWLLQQQPL